MKIGNKQNSFINREWRKVKGSTKIYTSRKRRNISKIIIRQELGQ